MADVTLPGTAMTTRFISLAQVVVLRAPERAAASTRTTPSLRAAIRRLRARKLTFSGWAPGGASLTTAPDAQTAACSLVWDVG